MGSAYHSRSNIIIEIRMTNIVKCAELHTLEYTSDKRSKMPKNDSQTTSCSLIMYYE